MNEIQELIEKIDDALKQDPDVISKLKKHRAELKEIKEQGGKVHYDLFAAFGTALDKFKKAQENIMN